jgi:hypothetical protein
MSEQVFDDAVLERWEELATEARRALTAAPAPNVKSPPSVEAYAALARLTVVIAEQVGFRRADWAVTTWHIERRPIAECVAVAIEEDLPWRFGGPESKFADPVYLAALRAAADEL